MGLLCASLLLEKKLRYCYDFIKKEKISAILLFFVHFDIDAGV